MSEERTLEEFVDGESPQEPEDASTFTSLDETSVGDIPKDWSAVRLGDLTIDTLYGANESAEEFSPDKPRYIRIKDIDDLGRLKDEEKASLSRDKAEGYSLKKGDMLFARSGSPGRTYLHRHNDSEFCYGGYSIKHELVSEGLNHEYLSQYTKSQRYWNWIQRIARTGAQANINSREYASLRVPLPPIEEQRKIATALHTIDQAILETREISQQVKRVKAGLASDLFHSGVGSNQTRDAWMGNIPQHWNVHEFANIVEFSQNGVYKGRVESGDNV